MERFVYRKVFGVPVGGWAVIPEQSRAAVQYLEASGRDAQRMKGLRLKMLGREIDLSPHDGAWHAYLFTSRDTPEHARESFMAKWPYNGVLIELVEDYLPKKLPTLTDDEVMELAQILGIRARPQGWRQRIEVILGGHAIHAGKRMGRYGGEYGEDTMRTLREWWVAKMERDVELEESGPDPVPAQESPAKKVDRGVDEVVEAIRAVMEATVDEALGIGSGDMKQHYERLRDSLQALFEGKVSS